jgi:DNA-binding GntR family transcriptional regulator
MALEVGGLMKKKLTLNEIAYEEIKKKIMRGDFIEENYTSQNQLVEELKMSRTPIVAALQRLQQEGFLKVISNQGILIQELSIKETNDFYDMRMAIEIFSMRKIVDQLTEDDFKNLEEIIKEQKVCYEQKDFFEFARLDAEYHQYLLQVGGNTLFSQTMANIRERLYYSSTNFLKMKKYNIVIFIEDHERMVEALKKGDIALAVKEMEDHLQKGKIMQLV